MQIEGCATRDAAQLPSAPANSMSPPPAASPPVRSQGPAPPGQEAPLLTQSHTRPTSKQGKRKDRAQQVHIVYVCVCGCQNQDPVLTSYRQGPPWPQPPVRDRGEGERP